MLVLGIESSCDETAAAVIQDGRIILSNVIASQIQIHSRYGGVVPEIASRKHIEAISAVTLQALENAAIQPSWIDGIGVTMGPGLVGSLLVGLSFAKGLALSLNVPYVGVNHLEGHVAASSLMDTSPEFPFVSLVVSGGHSNIYLYRGFGDYDLLGQTKDDAAGEAFDKAARLLNIGYPGGVVIEQLGRSGNKDRWTFPRAMRERLDFSFSGLKTSLLIEIKKRGKPFADDEIPDVASSFQEAIVDVLVDKTMRAAQEHDVAGVVVCGGVASNGRLRERFNESAALIGLKVFIPPAVLCTDNAAMIGAAAYNLLEKGFKAPWDLNAVSRWPRQDRT